MSNKPTFYNLNLIYVHGVLGDGMTQSV